MYNNNEAKLTKLNWYESLTENGVETFVEIYLNIPTTLDSTFNFFQNILNLTIEIDGLGTLHCNNSYFQGNSVRCEILDKTKLRIKISDFSRKSNSFKLTVKLVGVIYWKLNTNQATIERELHVSTSKDSPIHFQTPSKCLTISSPREFKIGEKTSKKGDSGYFWTEKLLFSNHPKILKFSRKIFLQSEPIVEVILEDLQTIKKEVHTTRIGVENLSERFYDDIQTRLLEHQIPIPMIVEVKKKGKLREEMYFHYYCAFDWEYIASVKTEDWKSSWKFIYNLSNIIGRLLLLSFGGGINIQKLLKIHTSKDQKEQEDSQIVFLESIYNPTRNLAKILGKSKSELKYLNQTLKNRNLDFSSSNLPHAKFREFQTLLRKKAFRYDQEPSKLDFYSLGNICIKCKRVFCIQHIDNRSKICPNCKPEKTTVEDKRIT